MKSEVKGTATSKRLGNTALDEHSTEEIKISMPPVFIKIFMGKGTSVWNMPHMMCNCYAL